MSVFTEIKNSQTSQSYYKIYKISGHNNLPDGYYYWDDERAEFDSITGESLDNAYYGPYPDLDSVCKYAHKHYIAIMSL